MAGVLFIIWIPCERYEQVLSNKPMSSNNGGIQELSHSTTDDCIDDFFVNSKEPKESRPSSLDTYTVSIDSDSLNKKDAENDKMLQRTKSADDLTPIKTSDDRSREKQGSMDSDKFARLMKDRALRRENEEAVEKFFNDNPSQSALDKMSMEGILRIIIEQLRIKNASWVRVNNGNSYQVTFSLENGVRCDDTIHMLSEFGVGQKEGSSVAIVPCTVYSDHRRLSEDDDGSTSAQSVIKETAWNKFINSVRARMNVAKIVEAVKSSATLTFDFVSLLIVASILACFGLVEDSTLFLAASMLISPLMGPILAATFGAVIKDHKLQYWGIANEIIGIFSCIFVGFIFGLVNCGLNFAFEQEKQLGLTNEMKTRTDLHSVIVGIFIALPSGAAVAISVLGENFGSLIGVAISASLLPPAVNTGLLWAYSCIHLICRDMTSRFETFVKEPKYSDDQALDLLFLGGISLLVTLTNVLCIYFMGFVFLKLKEVAPVSEDQRQFWKHDIKIARDYNKTLMADEGRKMQEELAQFHENGSENFRGVGAELLRQTFHPHTNTWSPLTLRHYRKEINNTSLSNLDTLYINLAGKSKHHNHTRAASPQHDTFTDGSHNKRSNPIFISPKHNADHSKVGSAPLDVITEVTKKIQHESTVVTFESSPGPSAVRKKKFIVTPANDPLM